MTPGGTIVTDTADAGTRPESRIPIDLEQTLVLDVHNPLGDVTVRAADRADVLISHGMSGLFEDPGADEGGLIIDARENRIEVRPHPHVGPGWAGVAADLDLDAVFGQISKAFRWGGPWSVGKPGKARVAFGRHGETDIVIEVPRSVRGRFAIHTASGDLRIEGVTGEITLHTASGDIHVARTAGDLTLQTASGDLAIEGASGRLTANAVSGDVRVTTAQMDGFQIQSVNGDILLDTVLAGDGPFRAQTASGDVRLTLRRAAADGEEPAATLAFHTVSGDAHVTPPFRKTDRRLWQAGPGDGGSRIEVTTVSGDLAAGISAAESVFVPAPSPAVFADDVPPAPPEPPAPPRVPAPPSPPTAPAPSPMDWPRGELAPAAANGGPEAAQPAAGAAARLAVLEAVERGEIDVEEALRRLEATDFSTSTNP
jgi:hypothetical protein